MEPHWRDGPEERKRIEAFNRSYDAYVNSGPAIEAHRIGEISALDPERWIAATKPSMPKRLTHS